MTDPVEWIRAHAAPMRTIDPMDDDFGDLDAFGRMVGDARVVQLGEICHGEGATFHAKTRLAKFLHQSMGFNVIAWESGLYDCHVSWQAFLAGKPARESAALGIFGTWTASVQSQPMFEYIAGQAAGPNPLRLVGMDSQLSGPGARKMLVADVKGRAGDDAVHLAAAMVGEGDMSAELISAGAAAFLAAADATSDQFWKQCLKSLAAQAQASRHLLGEEKDVARYSQERDLQMGDNMVWLANTAFPEDRIIIWADNGHMTKSFAPLHLGAEEPVPDYISCGNVLKQAIGDAFFSIGATAYEGEAGHSEGERNTQGTRPLGAVGPAPADSFEDLFIRAGLENAIIDLRPQGPGSEWLREPRESQLIFYTPRLGAWPDVVDGMLFTRVMYPSDRIGPP